MAKLNSAEERILKEIVTWKAKSPGLLSRATHLVSKPLVWVGDKFIPEEAKTKMSDLTEKIVDRIHDFSQWTVDDEEVLKATKEFEIDSATIISLRKASIFDLDHVTESWVKQNRTLAAAEGFGTGIVGWPGLIADLPALFTLCFRLVYQCSLTYGYPVHNEDGEEEEFEIGYMLRVFRVATASEKEEKMQALLDLKDYESSHRGEMTYKFVGDYTAKQIGKTAAVAATRAIVNQIIKQTFARKAITSIPGIGAILTAGFNYAYVDDVGEAARMLYRERFLLDKKGRTRIINVDIQ